MDYTAIGFCVASALLTQMMVWVSPKQTQSAETRNKIDPELLANLNWLLLESKIVIMTRP